MTYTFNSLTSEIIDDDGQVVATLSDNALPEQGEALVRAYNNELRLLTALRQARSEIWRLLDAKGIDPKQARVWPEIVLADEAIAGYAKTEPWPNTASQTLHWLPPTP